MRGVYKKIIHTAIVLFMLSCIHDLRAQVTVRYSGNATGLTTTCTDAVWSNDPERSFELEIRPVTGGSQVDGGGRVTVPGGCSNTANANFGTRDADIILFCSGAVVNLRGRAGESDAAFDCGGLDCGTPWSSWTSFTVNNTANQSWGPVAVSGGGSSGNLSSTISFSGDFRVNARNDGNKNFSCATAWALPVNATGTYFNSSDGARHTTNCGDAWYAYTLTDPNRSYIEFEPTAGNSFPTTNTSEIVEVKYISCSGCPLGGGTGWFGNTYRVDNPKPGTYYVRVRVNSGVISSADRRFYLEVRKGGNIAAPGNDDIACATNLNLNFNSNLTGNSNNINASIQVGVNNSNACTSEPRKDEDRTVWYQFTTPATVNDMGTNLKVRVANAGGDNMTPDIILYRLNDAAYSFGTCATPVIPNWSKLTEVARSSGTYLVDDDAEINLSCGSYLANTTYYLQINDEGNTLGVGYNEGNFSYQVQDNGFQRGPDDRCSAYDLGTYAGTIPSGGPKYSRTDASSGLNAAGLLDRGDVFTINRESNRCAGNNGNPNNPNKDVWYKFATGTNIGSQVTVQVNSINNLDAFVGVYKYCSTSGCPSYAALASNEVTTGGGYSPLGGPDNATATFTPEPNTTYYIQVDGYSPILGVGGGEAGDFNLTVSMNNLRNPYDDICTAETGTQVLTNSLGLGQTVTRAGLNNQNATNIEGCNNEPNASGNDATVWFSFQTGANPGTEIRIETYNENSDDCSILPDFIDFSPNVYEKTGAFNCNSFAGLALIDEAGLFGGGCKTAIIDCPKPNTWYYIQVQASYGLDCGIFSSCETGTFDLRVIDNGLNAGPDFICEPATSSTPGVNGFLGVLNSSNNVNLTINNQTTRCANVSSGEPDNTTILSGLNNTVWYRFRTPAADYSDNTLMHLYDIEVNRLSSSSSVTYPALYFYEESSTTNRPCGDSPGDYANLIYLDRDEIDPLNIFNGGHARVRDQCLKPNTNYYIQVDPVGGIPFVDSWVDFNVVVKKSAFRPGNRICDATVIPASVVSGLNHTTTVAQPELTAAPFFGLPHSNKCASADNGEPDISPGGPGAGGTHSASVWYQYTTDANPAEWIEWDHDDITSGRGVRGALCAGLLFNTKINIYESSVNGCVYPSLILQSEHDLPWEVPYVNAASTSPGIYRQKCPKPNTTYYVQVKDMGTSPCFEGVYNPIIKTASTTRSVPVNDEPCGAVFLGTVPAGGTLAPTQIFDNFCATPTKGFIADQTQPLEADVWFAFVAPPSGSVLITAQSAPSGSPSADNDIDLQVAVWEPILGDANQTPHCSSPRYLWTPIVSRDHDILDYADVPVISTTYYNILDTRNNLINEGNSLIATCLNPGKMYYIQVDGGDYFMCDFLNGGNCIMGYFQLQIKDAGLYDMASMASMPAGNDEPCGAKTLPVSSHSGSLQWTVGSNLCASAINDPLPSAWHSSDATVWYKFTAPASGKVKIRAENINQINRRDKSSPNSPNPSLTPSDPDYHEEINLQLAVYTMGNCLSKGSLVEHTSSYDGMLVEMNPTDDDNFVSLVTNGFDEYLVARCLIPGKEYYIVVDGENDPTLGPIGFRADIEDVIGDFRISVQDYATVPASLNDNVCQAFDITGVNGLSLNANVQTGLFNNECATIQPNIEGAGKIAEKMRNSLTPGLFSVSAKKTLWFKFRAPASGKVLIQGINSGNDKIDLAMALYDFPGENCNLAASGFKVVEDYDPGVALWGEDEDLTVECLVPGRYYYLQVDGAENPVACIPGSLCATGEYRIRITHLPSDPRSDILPQKNDNFCDAINLGPLNPGNVKTRSRDNNRCSTEEINEPGGSGWNFSLFDDQERTVWYRFRTGLNLGPLAPGKFTIVVNNPDPDPCFDIDIELFEYSGVFAPAACNIQANSNTQFNRLLKVGKGSPMGLIPLTDANRSESLEIDCPRPNTDYFLRVSGSTTCPGFGATMGEFDIRIEMDGISIMAAENDDICGATNSVAGNMGNLASGGTLQRLAHNNFCATQELGEPNTSQSAVQSEPEYDETMWYRFRTSATPGEIKVKLETVLTTGFASVPSLTVYKGNTANYNPCGSSGFSGLIEVASDMGAAALFGVTKWDAEVTLPCPSANTYYFIQVDGADASLFGFTLPGFDDNFIYNVRVTDDGSGSARPSNDKVAGAIPVDDVDPLDGQLTVGGMLTIKGHNMCATADDDEPRFSDLINAGVNGSNTTDHQNGLEDETVWFYFTTPDKPGVINVRVQDDPAFPESFSPNFAIFYNNGTNPTYRITEAPSSKLIQEGTESSAVTGTSTNKNYTCLLPNTRYYIQIDGNDLIPTRTDQGRFIVTVTDDSSGVNNPANDLICSAEDLTSSLVNGGTANFNRTNYCSWEEIAEPNTSGNMGGTGDDVTSNDYDETVWFKFRPAWEGQYTVSVTNTHNFILYRSTTGNYNCNNPSWNNLTQMSTSNGLDNGTFSCLDDNVWYYVQVDGDDTPGDDFGPFTLTITHVAATIPSHDMICNAYDLGTVNATTSTAANQNNICATEESGEPNVSGNYNNINAFGYDKTLWYRFRTPAQIGDWTISVTNNSPFTDRISGTFTLYQAAGANACSGGAPVWSNLTERMNAGIANVTNGNNSEFIECFRLEPNTYYFLQVHGEDAGIFGETGTNFNVSVTHSPATVGANDNVCSAQLLSVGGAAYTDNNICAGTQQGEPDIAPNPQHPFTNGYDETMWYRFVAPAEGYVKIEGRSLASNPVDLSMTLYELPQGVNNICTGGVPNWILLNRLASVDNLVSYDFDYENECLIPGRTYLFKIDGVDTWDDRGNYTVRVLNQYLEQPVVCPAIANDEPCGLTGAFDLTAWVRETSCSSGSQFYASGYTIFDGSPDIDCARRSASGMSCGNRTNCSDYWFQFTVPMDSEGGVKIQGEDEYGFGGANSSTLVVGAYRGNPCTGQMQFLGCDHGGTGKDVEFDIAAIPGETIYLQVFNDNGAANPAYPSFGLCVSTRCEPKTACSAVPTLEYDIPQCWNLDEDNSPVNNSGGVYGNCLPGGATSANYFTFSTECGATSDGEPDTVTLVFSVNNVGSNTAIAIYEDATPCDGVANGILVNCVPFGNCTGCSPSTTFSQTYQLEECKTYVVQILGEDDDDDGSSGQIYIFKTSLTPPVLPVELLSFTGYHDGQDNLLNWITASEKNVDKFIVEKSVDGKNFSAIGIVGAYGTTSEPQNYHLLDTDAWIGNNYYRLRMMDIDGKYEYSNVINIEVGDKPTEQITRLLSVYPNPTDAKTRVEMYVHESQADFNIKVVNVLGQLMHSEFRTFSKGVASFEVDATRYAQGSYVISVINKNTSEVMDVKFIKQ